LSIAHPRPRSPRQKVIARLILQNGLENIDETSLYRRHSNVPMHFHMQTRLQSPDEDRLQRNNDQLDH
jgi:hypothetical protein